ncbi:hypothetical protein COLINT_03795, partial [Collinsella intestinalis DSM 13280]
SLSLLVTVCLVVPHSSAISLSVAMPRRLLYIMPIIRNRICLSTCYFSTLSIDNR